MKKTSFIFAGVLASSIFGSATAQEVNVNVMRNNNDNVNLNNNNDYKGSDGLTDKAYFEFTKNGVTSKVTFENLVCVEMGEFLSNLGDVKVTATCLGEIYWVYKSGNFTNRRPPTVYICDKGVCIEQPEAPKP